MTISIQDLVRLSRIGEELRRDDPELAGRLPRMNGRPRSWRAASYGVLTVSAGLALIGLVISKIGKHWRPVVHWLLVGAAVGYLAWTVPGLARDADQAIGQLDDLRWGWLIVPVVSAVAAL